MKINNTQGLIDKKTISLAVIFLFISFLSCKKEGNKAGTDEEKKEFASVVSESEAEADAIFDNSFDNAIGVSDEVGLGGTGVFGFSSEQNIGGELNRVDSNTCFTVSYAQAGTNRFPLTVTIDFDAGCTGKDGRTRKGKIVIVYTGRLVTAGNSASIHFDGYSVDGVQVEGTQTINNTSTIGKRSFIITVAGAKLTWSNGNFIEWNSEKTIAQTEGLATIFLPSDDVFSLTGQSGGSAKKGDKFFTWGTQISEPLVKKFTCRWITKGVIALKKGNDNVAVLDYGSGNCDNKASFTVNGVAYEITLH